jgi:hypothetical protein
MRDEAQDFAKAQSYVGVEYVPGVYDCGHLFLDVQRQVFGRKLALPEGFGPHSQGRAGQARQIANVRDELATRIQDPVHGCAVLLTTPTDNGALVWHIGTVFIYRGEVWVLHNSHAMGSASLNRLRDFAWRGQRIEGFYTWK